MGFLRQKILAPIGWGNFFKNKQISGSDRSYPEKEFGALLGSLPLLKELRIFLRPKIMVFDPSWSRLRVKLGSKRCMG